MKFKFNKKYIAIGIIAFFVIALAIVFFFACFQIDSFKEVMSNFFRLISPVVYGFIIAYMLIPIVNFVDRKIFYRIALRKKDYISNRKKKVFRVLSIIITFALVGFLISLLIKSLIPQITDSMYKLQEEGMVYLNRINGWINSITAWANNFQQKYMGPDSLFSSMFNPEDIGNALMNFFTGLFTSSSGTGISDWAGKLTGVFVDFFKNVGNVLIGFVISIYVLMNKELLAAQAKKIVYSVLSLEKSNNLLRDLRFVSDTFLGFIVGKIVDSIIIGFLCYIGLLILNMPFPVLLSVVIGVTNVIPFFGPIIGAVPTAFIVLIATFNTNPWMIVYFIIFVIILQQLDGNVIGPAILGSSTGISGMWVIFSITFFGGLWGVVGMFIGIPIFSVCYAMIKRSVERRLNRRELPTQTWEYLPIKRIDINSKKIVPLIEANDLNYKGHPISGKDMLKKLKSFSLIKRKHTLYEGEENEETNSDIEK